MNIKDNLVQKSIGIVIDPACDLPAEFISKFDIEILPVNIKTNFRSFIDLRWPDSSVHFFQKEMTIENFDADTHPYTPDEISQHMELELINKWDEILVMTINAERSKIYKNIREAISISKAKFKTLRRHSGSTTAFRIHLFDTKTMFTGQAVLAYEAIRLIREEGLSSQQAITQLEVVRRRVRAFLLPRELSYLKNKASKKGDKSISWLSYKIGGMLNVKPIIECYQGETAPIDKAFGFDKGLEKIFDRVTKAVSKGLSIQVVSMSYAGDLAEIEADQHYQSFCQFLAQHNVESMLAVMSTTAGINVGPKSFSIAYAE